MPRSKPRIDRGFLRGPRLSRETHTLARQRGGYHHTVIEPVLVDGNFLNVPESVIYYALEELHINFTAQAVLGQGRALGGAIPDFLLHDYDMVLGFHGPHHFTYEGKQRDFWREVMYSAFDLISVFLVDEDLRDEANEYSIDRTKGSIMRVIGNPLTSSLMSRRY